MRHPNRLREAVQGPNGTVTQVGASPFGGRPIIADMSGGALMCIPCTLLAFVQQALINMWRDEKARRNTSDTRSLVFKIRDYSSNWSRHTPFYAVSCSRGSDVFFPVPLCTGSCLRVR
jgi:hypothetical protein